MEMQVLQRTPPPPALSIYCNTAKFKNRIDNEPVEAGNFNPSLIYNFSLISGEILNFTIHTLLPKFYCVHFAGKNLILYLVRQIKEQSCHTCIQSLTNKLSHTHTHTHKLLRRTQLRLPWLLSGTRSLTQGRLSTRERQSAPSSYNSPSDNRYCTSGAGGFTSFYNVLSYEFVRMLRFFLCIICDTESQPYIYSRLTTIWIVGELYWPFFPQLTKNKQTN